MSDDLDPDFFDRFADKVKRRARDKVKAQGERILREVKDLAADDPEYAESFRGEFDPRDASRPEAVVYTNHPEALEREYGTEFRPPEPAMRVALIRAARRGA